MTLIADPWTCPADEAPTLGSLVRPIVGSRTMTGDAPRGQAADLTRSAGDRHAEPRRQLRIGSAVKASNRLIVHEAERNGKLVVIKRAVAHDLCVVIGVPMRPAPSGVAYLLGTFRRQAEMHAVVGYAVDVGRFFRTVLR